MNISTRRQFHKYPNRYLVESGSYFGDAIADALNCGFENVISFEVKKDLYEHCVKRFKGAEDKVKLILGSSAKLLYEGIKDINEPITFWLDGHYSSGVTGYDPENISPILRELEQIKRHPIRSHTIMIDDRRLFKSSSNGGLDGLFDVDEAVIIEKLLDINPNYTIIFENGHIENDIIVATLQDCHI